MTPRENMLRAARRQNPDWIPFDFGVSRETRHMFKQRLGADVNFMEYFRFDGRWLGPAHRTRRPTPDWRALYYADVSLPEHAEINQEWGFARVPFPDTDDDQRFHPLWAIQSEQDLDAYPWPDDVGAPFRYEGMAERVRQAQDDGHAVFGSGLDYFEHLWGLTGFEVMLAGMAADEPWARRMFSRHAEDLVRTATAVAGTGIDFLQTGSDVATQLAPLMSPAMWRDWIFPLMRDAIAAAKKVKPDLLVLYHSDGNVEPLIDGFIEAGIDVLDPIQPEAIDLRTVKERYGDRLAFHGGIGVQTTLPFGTPREVYDTVCRTIELMSAGGGGYLCSPSHKIRPEVPWENILALVDAVRSFGHP